MKIFLSLLGAASLAALPVAADAAPNRAGKQVGQSRTGVNPAPRGASGRGGPGNQQAYKAGKAAGSRQQRDVVVVGSPGNGHYDHGHYEGPRDWDDDDNDFLEFVGKTAAVTAGVSVVSAVIGDIVKDKPQGCQPANIGGQQYVNCNGTYYQQVPNGYQVVAPPQ